MYRPCFLSVLSFCTVCSVRVFILLVVHVVFTSQLQIDVSAERSSHGFQTVIAEETYCQLARCLTRSTHLAVKTQRAWTLSLKIAKLMEFTGMCS